MSRCDACGSRENVSWAAIHDCFLCEKCKAMGRTPNTEEYR